MLGLRTVRALVLATNAFSVFGQGLPAGMSLKGVRDHSVAVASLAKSIAEAEGLEATVSDEALIAGLLHDVGKLVLATKQTRQYYDVLRLSKAEGLTLFEAEREVFSATHAEVGAYLLGLWGFSDLVIEAVGLHHTPAASAVRECSPLVAVHVANALEQEGNPTADIGPRAETDTAYLSELGLVDRLFPWRDLCQQAVLHGGGHD